MQALEVPEDFLAHIQSAVRLDVPVLASGSSGFTPITINTTGGSITPSGSVHISDGIRFAIQIQTGGPVATATFKTSMDGGNTYGALQTTAASMTDATSGITLAFVGTFTTLGVALFRSAYTPLTAWADAGAVPRYAVDYLGYPLGTRLLQFQEQWIGLPGAVTSGSFTPATRWQVATSGAGTGCNVQSGASVYATPSAQVNCGSAVGAYSCLYTALQIVMPNTNQVTVLEWDANLALINNVGIWGVAMGFDIAVPFLGTLNGARLVAGSNVSGVSNSNWWMQNGKGSAATTTDTGVATALTVTKFRLEIHGSGSPYGASTRFFINGGPPTIYNGANLVPTNGTANLYITMLANSGDTNGGRQLLVGGVNCVINRFATATIGL